MRPVLNTPRTHVAIVTPDIADALASGRKTVETRFTRTRRSPLGAVARGDEILFKISAGEFIGRCRVRKLKTLLDLRPADLCDVRRRHGDKICAPTSYWQARRDCRYGLLMWLGPLRAIADPPTVPRQYGAGWITLPDQ